MAVELSRTRQQKGKSESLIGVTFMTPSEIVQYLCWKLYVLCAQNYQENARGEEG